ncbi:MAG: ATP-binding protein [Clostridia bacterium]|nr:ATP-binding protein [Clostridia bacterium]
MLTKVRVKNFKSFKNETTIDFLATKYSMLKDTNSKNGILKGCMFVGGNATGKTNAIYSISMLLDLLLSNANTNMPANFCLFSKEPEMDLEYTFIFDKDVIKYFLVFDKQGIVKKEQVLLNEDSVLDRIGLNARTSLTENQNYDNSDIDARTLFLKSIYFNTKFTNFPALKKWFEYMSGSVYFNAERQQALIGQALSFNVNNKVNLADYLEAYGVERINKFFKDFGFSQEIFYGNRSNNPLNQFGVKELYMLRKDIDYWMPYFLESLGNKTLLSMLPGLLQVVEKGGMFIVDEFSSAFHNELEELIVRYFMRQSHNAQMFFVSHSTNLMKTTLLRPDQIYAIDFDNQGSRIKRASSEQPRESQNMEKMYLSGIFGGLPNYSNGEE